METLYSGNVTDTGSCSNQAQEVCHILLYSPHHLAIKGIKGMLIGEPGIYFVGEATNWFEATLKIHEHEPSLVIINDDGPGYDSSNIPEPITALIREFPKLNILAILNTSNHDKEMAALKLGIKGVLIENFETDVLLDSIKCISGGALWFRRSVLETFVFEQLYLCRLKENGRQELTLPTFTRRELEIIQMAGKGVKNREIGRNLFISEKTVKHHLSKIFKKLRIRKRAELKVYL